MTSFAKIQRCLATTASTSCLALYVICFGCSWRIFYVFWYWCRSTQQI